MKNKDCIKRKVLFLATSEVSTPRLTEKTTHSLDHESTNQQLQKHANLTARRSPPPLRPPTPLRPLTPHQDQPTIRQGRNDLVEKQGQVDLVEKQRQFNHEELQTLETKHVENSHQGFHQETKGEAIRMAAVKEQQMHAAKPSALKQRPQSRGEPTTDLYHTRPIQRRSRDSHTSEQSR